MSIEALQKAATAYQGNMPTADTSKNTGESLSADIPSEKSAVLRQSSHYTQVKNTMVREDDKRHNNFSVNVQDKQNDYIKKAIEEINKSANNSEAIFGIHDATNRVMIKIVDKESKKVLREYPPEETLDMIAKVWELAGLMVDEKR